ncbi:MAG: putative DNA modification/repair radical SAM protein, partial [Bacillota bacterium]|nr:putative DNA modification/repair radical SAM protein [Bacillota bacterium]
MDVYEKLRILAEGAKYDASCATSGVNRKNSGKMGNASCMGVCHSWSADGRCISLLKVLLSNDCAYNCQYCVNRRTAEVERASFEPEELASLTMEFYRRNYIEGLFLSSAVEGTPDRTAERMLRCLTLLRETHLFAGYIHVKVIPGVSPELIGRLGMAADRLSVNIELPSRESLGLLAPQKKAEGILTPMKQITEAMEERRLLRGGGESLFAGSGADFRKDGGKLLFSGGRNGGPAALGNQGTEAAVSAFPAVTGERRYREKFAPAGQSTQMIIGASPESDRQILRLTESLYRNFRMKRVYFSAYIPVNESPLLPALLTAPPLRRENRLYQADWLLRFYGFRAEEVLDEAHPFLDPDLDPKISWALRHLEQFPMEVNKASLEELLRVPGIGPVSARRILRQRRLAAVRFEDLKKMGVAVKRACFFITCSGRYYGSGLPEPEYIKGKVLEEEAIRSRLLPPEDQVQLSMFAGESGAGALPFKGAS